ncbi:MAG: ATP-binding protein [Thalassobaculum sp.]|uniref:hybrid sensor histidine kinase/response regulator n=1 Tax=Thalassobaculum sp. TaxID=2022740 RepID=UPI0032EEAB1A
MNGIPDAPQPPAGSAHLAAAEALSVASATLDAAGVVLEASPLFVRWTAGARERCVGSGFADHLHPDDRPGFAAALANWRRRLDADSAIYVWRLGGDGERRVRAALRPFGDGGRSFYALVLAEHAVGRSAVDAIADSQRADAQAVALRAVFDKLPLAVVVGHNADRRWLYVNGQFTRMTGYTLDDIGSTFDWYERAYPDPAYRAEVLAGYEARRSSGMARIDDYTSNASGTHIRCKDGSGRFVRTTAFTFQETTIAVLVDITEHKALETSLLAAREAAEQANRAKSQFLASMSHEIRTPMNAVLGFAQLCSMQPDLNERVRDHLATILRAGEHLLTLINGILDMSRIESGRVAIDLEAFDPGDLLASACDLLAARARSKGLDFDLAGAGTLPPAALGDAGRIRQIVFNLIGNAIKFTARGHVRVEATVDRDGGADDDIFVLRVAVEDSGPGIAEDELARLFRPFEQAAAGRDAGDGTGLGLAISREYARLMDGDITVRSSPGRGSRFVFSVPLRRTDRAAAARPALPELPRRLAPGQAVPRILVVDDREANRRLLVGALEAVGFVTRDCRDGVESLAQFAEWAPDAVLVDLELPGIDGAEVIRRIRAAPQRCDTPVIVVSAVAFEADRQRALRAGADAYLAKPVQLADVFGHLGRLLDLRYA